MEGCLNVCTNAYLVVDSEFAGEFLTDCTSPANNIKRLLPFLLYLRFFAGSRPLRSNGWRQRLDRAADLGC